MCYVLLPVFQYSCSVSLYEGVSALRAVAHSQRSHGCHIKCFAVVSVSLISVVFGMWDVVCAFSKPQYRYHAGAALCDVEEFLAHFVLIWLCLDF